MKNKSNIIDSFNYAVSGLLFTIRTERNMKIHIAAAISVLFLSFFFRLTAMEVLFIMMAICFVIMAELFNTAIEKVGDAVTKEKNPYIKQAKDITAAAVLVSAIFAVAVGYVVFQNKTVVLLDRLIHIVIASPLHIAFIGVFISLVLVVLIKTITKKGTPFHGGFPSGHSGVAFCLATMIVFVTQNVYAGVFAFSIALLVAQSRIKKNIHSFIEVFFGGILGIMVAVLLYKILEVIT